MAVNRRPVDLEDEFSDYVDMDEEDPFIIEGYVTGDTANLPTADEKAALAGTEGTPSATNPYRTHEDGYTVTADEKDAMAGTYGAPSDSNAYVTSTDPRVAYYLGGAGVDGQVTLTLATTAYQIPAAGSVPAAPYTLFLANDSDTKMYVRTTTGTTAGIPVSPGGTFTVDLAADAVMYAYCGSAGKVLNVSSKEVSA